jgi:uridine phosphorylase
MGVSMMDFFVRESRAIVDGPMIIIRFGTCGGISPDAKQGKIALASEGSGYVIRNPDAFDQFYPLSDKELTKKSRVSDDSYHFYQIAPADPELSSHLESNLKQFLGDDIIIKGANVTAESFYSSQGRIDDRFHDDNQSLIEAIRHKYPNAKSMEMESFQLFHLAKCSTTKIKAAAAAIIVANRLDCGVVEDDVLLKDEEIGGHAVLKTIAEATL